MTQATTTPTDSPRRPAMDGINLFCHGLDAVSRGAGYRHGGNQMKRCMMWLVASIAVLSLVVTNLRGEESAVNPDSLDSTHREAMESTFSNAHTQALIQNAVNGDIEQVQSLATSEVDIDAHGQGGITPLIWSAAYGQETAVRTLLEAGADPKGRDQDGDTALHFAAAAGEPEICELLVEAGLEVDVKNEQGATPLMYAVAAGRHATVEELLGAGAEVNERDQDENTPLHFAAASANTTSAGVLLENGADLTASNEDGLDSFTLAASSDNPHLSLLLSQMVWEASPTHIFDDPEVAALAEAAANGDREKVRKHAEEGADVNGEGFGGITPLVWAMRAGNYDGFKSLLEVDAEPKEDSESGYSTLYMAASLQDVRFLRALVSYPGAPIDLGPNGRTPLMESAGNGFLEHVKVLLEHSADVHAQDALGTTATYDAVISRSPEILHLLLQHGATPDHQDEEGRTPLDYAEGIQAVNCQEVLSNAMEGAE